MRKTENANFEDKNINQKKFEKILMEISKSFDFYDKKYGYGIYIDKDDNDKCVLKDKEGLIKKILSDEENFDYLIQNIPGFIMSSGGLSKNVSTILTGRPSK